MNVANSLKKTSAFYDYDATGNGISLIWFNFSKLNSKLLKYSKYHYDAFGNALGNAIVGKMKQAEHDKMLAEQRDNEIAAGKQGLSTDEINKLIKRAKFMGVDPEDMFAARGSELLYAPTDLRFNIEEHFEFGGLSFDLAGAEASLIAQTSLKIKDGIPTGGGRRAFSLNELDTFIGLSGKAQEELTQFINVLHDQKGDSFNKIMSKYGYLDSTDFDETRKFLIEKSRETIELIRTVPVDKLYYRPGRGVGGEATYYKDYRAIGFGDNVFKDHDVSTITHEYSHAVFTAPEANRLTGNDAIEYYQIQAENLARTYSYYLTENDIAMYAEIKTNAYVFESAVDLANSYKMEKVQFSF